jgi:hypothetical protein
MQQLVIVEQPRRTDEEQNTRRHVRIRTTPPSRIAHTLAQLGFLLVVRLARRHLRGEDTWRDLSILVSKVGDKERLRMGVESGEKGLGLDIPDSREFPLLSML